VADTFFVRFRGRTVGPYSLSQAQQMARKGQLSRTTEVSSDGQSWSQAGNFPAIFERPTTSTPTSPRSSHSVETDFLAGPSASFPAFDVPKTPSLSDWYYTSGDEQRGPTSAGVSPPMTAYGERDSTTGCRCPMCRSLVLPLAHL